MELTLERFVSDKDTTLGVFFIDDIRECFCVEDRYRTIKAAGSTRIPAGIYPIRVRKHGGFHARYGRKFSAWHRGMLELRGVPGFTDILIHIGNGHTDTAGCLLVNSGVLIRDDRMIGQASTDAYRKFYGKVIESAEAENLTIDIIDRDRG